MPVEPSNTERENALEEYLGSATWHNPEAAAEQFCAIWDAARAADAEEITAAEIEAVARVMFEPPSVSDLDPEYSWAEMVAEDPSRADMWRTDARAALEAARLAVSPVTPEELTAIRQEIADETGYTMRNGKAWAPCTTKPAEEGTTNA